MIKSENKLTTNEPICKKIQNYIFKFTDMLGKGNFSKVYKAHHEITNETVAIKIIELNSLKSQKLEELLFSQIDVLKKLNHPNILQCYQVFTSNRNCYIITQICNGGDLETKLRRQHHFTQISSQPIIKDIFNGLLYLAQKHVIHRDLKVANVFLHNGRAKIADFGFAKFTIENFKDINIGSPIYMSPEGLIQNIYGAKTDIWAFGVLIYELLHGQTPYANCRTQAQLKYHVSIPITTKKMREQLSPQIKQLITLCMEVDQNKRITAFDLQKLPYFQKLLDKSPLRRMDSPGLDKKFSTTSQKYVGTPNTLSQHTIQRHNFLMSKQDKKSRGQIQNKSPSPISIPQHRFQNNNPSISPYEKRGISYQKRPFEYRGNQQTDTKSDIKSHQTPSIQSQHHKLAQSTSKIFSSTFTFKQCVNLLHYCRLVYKYIILLKQTHRNQQQQIRTLSGWVLYFMQQIKNKINQGTIIYQGQNGYMRQKKLREVTNQYTKKYTHQLSQFSPTQICITLLLNSLKNYYQKIDTQIITNKNDNWLIHGHYIILIIQSTNILKKCYEEHNYRIYSTYKQLEQFLNKNKDSMDLHSFKMYRKKISFSRERIN